ncbi:hypothetical protein KbCgl_30830 [Corynebacterium glutamicum]|nr:hypothetical protein KbCgl_30830 [Corynebacterium glutamicum]
MGTSNIDAFVLSAADDIKTVRRAMRCRGTRISAQTISPKRLVERLDRYVRYRHVLSGTQGLSQDKIDQATAILNGTQAPVTVSRSATEQLLLDAWKAKNSPQQKLPKLPEFHVPQRSAGWQRWLAKE